MAKSIFQQSPMDAAIDEMRADVDPSFDALALPALDLPAAAPLPSMPSATEAPRAPRGGTVAIPAAFKSTFEQAALRYKVPVNILMAMAEQESTYNPMAVGVQTQWGRAKGIMQYLDSTAAGMGINPYDAKSSIEAAAKQIRERLDKGYSMVDAVREHHAGPDRKKWGAKTAAYGTEVLGRASRIKGMLAPEYEQRAPSGPWYSPGGKQPTGPVNVSADAIAAITGKPSGKPAVDASLTATIDNPNTLPAIIARHESEKQRRPDEGNLRPASRPGVAEQFGNDVERGFSNLKNLGVGAAALGADLVGADAAADKLLAQYIQNEEETASKNPAVIGSYKNIETLGDAGRYAVEAIGENLPMFLPSLVSGGAGAVMARKAAERGVANFIEARVAAGVSREVAERQAAEFVARRAMMGSAAGASASSVGMESGSIYGDTFSETGEKAPGLSLAFGIPAGMLDAIEPVYALRRVAGPIVDELAGGILKRMGKEAGTQFLIEAGTEGLQTMLEEAPKSIQTGQPYWTPELLDRVIDAGLKGGIGGGVMGAATGAAQRPHRAEPAPIDAPADLPAAETAMPADMADISPAAPVAVEPAPPVEALPEPRRKGPLGRAMDRMPVVTPGIDVPMPLDPNAAPKALTLVTQGVEYPVTLLGETPTATWVKTQSGEELQIPHADIEAGQVSIIDAAAPIAATPKGKDDRSAPTDVDAQPVDYANSVDDLRDGFAEMGKAMGDSLVDMYVEQARVGSVKDKSGATSAILQVAKKVRDRLGGAELDRATVEQIAREVDAVATTGQERQSELRSIVDRFAPTRATASDDIVDADTGEVISAPAAPARSRPPRKPDTATSLEGLSEQDLRGRLKYLREQSRTNNGWTKPLLAEKKRVEAAINALAAPAAVDAIAQAESEAAMSPLNDLPEPTDAQKEAGNYKKGHANIGGLNVSIENPAGTSRRPEWPPLKHSYGYVKRSEGADGDHVDVFLGPKAADPANPVFIVDQVNKDGSFDEHKVMVGFADKGAARRGYLANYEKGWTGLGDLTEMPFEQFKDWVKDSANTLKPAGARVAAPAPAAATPAAAPLAEPESKRVAYHDYADPAENALGRTVVDAMNDASNRQSALDAIGDAVERGAVSPGFASVQLQRLGADRVEADAIVKRAPVNPSEETSVERQRRERAERRAAKEAAKADTASPAPASQLDAQEEKFRLIEQGFAENRKVMRNFKRGDEVEWDHNNFYRDGRGRTFTGIVDKIQSDEQGSILIRGINGTTPLVDARALRHRTAAPVTDAAAPSQPAPARIIRREPDKKNPNPYVRKGERYTVSEDVDYLSAGAVYEVESAEKRNAHFVNVESGGRTSLPNYRMQMALTKGVMEKVNPEAAQTAAEQSPAPTRPVAPAASKPAPFANNKLVTASQVEAARARIREKMNRINSGIDPELLTDGMVIAAAYIESGVRSFAAYAKAMRDDFGTRITPYLLSFWEGARHYPGLDTEGMTSPDASRVEHAALVAEGLPVEEAIALGTEVAKPKASKVVKTAAPAGARVLRDDWGVDHIDGWKPIEGGKNQETDYGLKGGLKDAFLADATAYLRAVASALRPLGFEPHINAKGKEENAVSRNASGVATSGDVSLHLRTAGGASIYATVGGTSLRGAVPTSKSGVAVMYRVSLKDGDKQATSGVNRWAPVDLTAIELADTIAWEASRQKPELTRDHVQPTRQSDEPGRRDAESVGRGGVSPDEERGSQRDDPAPGLAPVVVEERQSEDVGATGTAGADTEAGVRGAGADVEASGRASESGLSDDGRAGSGGARGTDDRAGGAGGGQQRPANGVAGRSAAPETEVAGRDGSDQRTGRGRGRNDGQLTEPDLFADASKKVGPVDPATVAPALPKTPSPARSGPGNFLIANPLEIVGGGPVARFDRNRQAIETYNMLRDEGRAATADEQRTLAGYTGWGSFGQELFQGTWQRPMPKEAWQERDRWLRDHLGREEWESAQRSITNAHYTDPPTVMAMWAMMQRMGFTGGRVLEPSMGIGNFFGMMPAEVADRSQLAGIELDRLTGGMAQLLYPDANVRIMPYQDSKTPDGFYDAVIGNWPFENTVIADRRYDRLSPFLHDYFFLKAVDQVRAGGIVMGITSSGSMDKKATGIRRELAKKAELVAAFRLPSGAFAEYAGTKVVTDIVILRKRAEPISLADNEGWINSVPYQTPNGEVSLNEYYVANPSHVIGAIDFGHGTTRGRPGMIVHRPDDMQEQLQRIIQSVPAGAYQVESRAKHISFVANHTSDREGSLVKQGDGLFVVRGEHLAPAAQVKAYAVKDAKITAAREDQISRLIEMRQRYGALIDAERNGDPAAARKALKSSYDAFLKQYGPLNDSFGLGYLDKIDDPFYPDLAALEIDGKPAAILSRSTMRAAPSIDNPTVAEAFVLARNSAVNPALSDIAARAGVTADEAKATLIDSGAVFELPSGDIAPSDIYLSGNVREKLRQAKAAVAEGMAHLQRNVDALAEVVPADVPYFKIETQLGATWVSPPIYAEFVGHMLGLPDAKGVEVRFNGGRWSVRLDDRVKNRPEARTGFGTDEYGFQKLVNAAFSNQSVTIRRKDSEGTSYVDHAATEEVNGKISEMRTKFGDWLWSDPERRVTVEAEYNEVRNAFATPKFDGSFLRFEGMALSLGNGPFDLRQHQADSIWRALVSRRSLNAHEVGTGKTFTMGGIAVESRRYGIARKPLILAHNANSKSVSAEIQQMYPAAKVLYINNLSPDTIDVKMRQIANDDWDAIVVPHSLIDRFAFKEDTLMEMAREEIAALEEEAYLAASDDGVKIDEAMWNDPEELKKLRSPTAKELVKMRQRIIESIRKQSHRASREGAISFEELGVDMLMVDEAHEFKKPPISTRMKMKGLNTQTSDRSIALSFLSRYVRAQNAGGNVHLFTGTPVTNTLTEVFHMMRYIMADEMQAAGVDTWDGWFGSFAREVMDVEQNAAAEYEAVTRLAGFINVPELRRMIGQYMDVVFADDMPEMQPRRTKSGKTMAETLTEEERAELLNGRTENAKDRPYKKVVNVTSDLTPEQKVIFEQLRGYARRWRSMTGKERRDAMAAGAPESPIVTEGLAAKASFDVRLYDGEALAGREGATSDDPGSKASRIVGNVKEIYDSHPLATQVIFAEQGMSNRATRSLGRGEDGKKRSRTFPTFSTVRDIVARLVASGIPREQIAVVDGSTSKEDRRKIANKMNAAKIRVVIGSTATLGVGVNMQKNLRAMHHMDAPWMPGDLEQRNGRGQRQGNQWNTVLEYRYLTDRLDGRRWQVLAIKQRFITSFLKADDTTRVIEGEAAADEQSDILQSFAEAAGDPRILIREKLRKQLDAVQRRERLHGQGVANALFQSRQLTKRADEWEAKVAAFDKAGTPEAVAKIVADNAGKGFTVTIDGKEFDKRKDADEAIQSFGAHNLRVGDEPRVFGTFGGHNLKIGWPAYEERPQLSMVIEGRGFDGGSMQGLEQSLRKFGPEIERMRRDVVESRASVERMQAMAAEPFHMSGELERYEAALAALELDIKANPVPPPAWLRAGAPVDTEVFWDGKPFNVTGHRWTADGWFVLADDAKGSVAIPYAEAKDAQGINVYEERPFEAPEVIEAKAGKDDASVVATPDSPAAHSIGGLHGGGFQSVEALEEHLEGTALGGSIAPLVRAGDIVLHASSDTLPTGGGLFSGQNQSDLRAWSRTIDAIVRGDPVNRAMIRLSRTPIVLQQLGMPDGELVMSRGKIAKARREHPSVPLAIWKDLPRLIADPRAVFPSCRGDGSMVLVIEGRDADNNPIFVPVVASQDGSSVVLSVYGKTDGDSVIATDLRRAIADKEPHYIRNGLADAFASPEGQAGVSPSHAPVASEVPTKPARKILSARDVVKKSAAIEGNVQGMTTPDGRVHLVADNLTSRTALPVILHEMFHAGVRPLVGEQTWTAMLKRLEVMYRAAAQRAASGERANSDFWAKALDRVDMAAPSQALEVEEFAAYAVEQQAQAPAGVQQAISRLIGAFKAWMVRRFGKQIGSITPSQLEALAKAALRAGTMAPRESTALSRVVPPAEQIDAATPGLIHNLVTKAMDGQFSVLGAAPLRPLIAELGAKIPAAQEYLALKLGMDTTRDQWHAKADEVAQPWLKFRMLHSADNTKLMDLMHESTLAGVDPAQEFKSALTNLDRQIIAEGPGTEAYDAAYAKAQNDTTRKSEHARLVPLFNALPAEGKRLFGQVRDTYRSLSAAFEQALLDNLSKALDIKLTQAQRAFDVEAMRVLNSGMTKEAADKAISAAERELLKAKQLQGWAKGARMTRLRHFFETNNLSGPYFPLARFGNFFVTVRDADDQVISFSRFEKPGDQQAFAKEMKEAGHDVQIGVLEDGGALKAQVDARFVADVEDILEGADVSDTVRDAVWQRWLESMPDMSIRTSRIHRKGRAGFSTDALRAFGHHMFHGSHQLARLKYALDMDEAIALARDQAKTMPDPVRAGLLVNEMARRHQFIMNPTGGPLAQTVTSAAFVWFLAASPAAALVNTSQTAVLGVPILAAYDGRAGVGSARAARELTRALRDFASGKGHAADAKRLTDDERKAMDAAYETGVIERTQSHDLAGVGETGVAYSPVRTKVMAAISWAFHHTERLNREVTFLAAYRMARAKNEPHQMAIDRAAELTWKIHFDYQNTSRPRAMQGDTAKMLFVFRNFNVNMLWRLFRDVHQTVKGDKAARKEAVIQLAGTTGMMMLSAGIRGTWMFGIAMMLASAFFGDDAEDDFQKAIVATLGRRLGGMAINGVPGHMLGIDLSNRIGMPDLWFRSPDRELEGQQEFDYWALQVMGAGVGTLRNMWTGVSMMADGYVERGVETMMPKFAKDVMRASRYMTEGARTLKGDPIMEDMPPADAIRQVLGFTPAALSERYDRNRSMKNREQRILDERGLILSDYDLAQRAGEDTAAIMDRLEAFNEANPDYPITGKSVRQSMRSRDRMRANKIGGVYLNQKLAARLNEEAPTLLYDGEEKEE